MTSTFALQQYVILNNNNKTRFKMRRLFGKSRTYPVHEMNDVTSFSEQPYKKLKNESSDDREVNEREFKVFMYEHEMERTHDYQSYYYESKR